MIRSNAMKVPPKTKIVFDYLVKLEDFATARNIVSAVEGHGITYQNVTAILHALTHYTAVASLESEGKLWFYATPDTDTRTKTLELRRPEEKPRRTTTRKAKSTPVV